MDARQTDGPRSSPPGALARHAATGSRAEPIERDDLSDDDALMRSFPGFVSTHLLSVVRLGGLSATIEVLRAIENTEGSLDGLRLTRVAHRLEHRIALVGLRSVEVRLLANRIATLPGVERVSIEYQMLRAASSA